MAPMALPKNLSALLYIDQLTPEPAANLIQNFMLFGIENSFTIESRQGVIQW
jgi:hypothetical protein